MGISIPIDLKANYRIGSTAPTESKQDAYVSARVANIVTKTKELSELANALKEKPHDQNLANQVLVTRQDIAGIVNDISKYANESLNNAIGQSNYSQLRGVSATLKQIQPTLAPLAKLEIDAEALLGLASTSKTLEQTISNADFVAKATQPQPTSITYNKSTSKPGWAIRSGGDIARLNRENLAAAQANQDPAAKLRDLKAQYEQDMVLAGNDPKRQQEVSDKFVKEIAPLLNANISFAQLEAVTKAAEMRATGADPAAVHNMIREAVPPPTSGPAEPLESGVLESAQQMVKRGLKPKLAELLSKIKDPDERSRIEFSETQKEQERIIAFLTELLNMRHQMLMKIISSMSGGRG
ncbi:MAG: hypothetical protein K1X64_08090 [Myxococcaceae bacterium]|nr:hypothetical protein [Myxococcaceae bacterium]